jgi:hypothetical protein
VQHCLVGSEMCIRDSFWLAQVYWCARGTEKNERSRDTLMILQSEEVEERREG